MEMPKSLPGPLRPAFWIRLGRRIELLAVVAVASACLIAGSLNPGLWSDVLAFFTQAMRGAFD